MVEEAERGGAGDCVRAGVHIEFVVERAPVRPDRVRGDEEAWPDLAGGRSVPAAAAPRARPRSAARAPLRGRATPRSLQLPLDLVRERRHAAAVDQLADASRAERSAVSATASRPRRTRTRERRRAATCDAGSPPRRGRSAPQTRARAPPRRGSRRGSTDRARRTRSPRASFGSSRSYPPPPRPLRVAAGEGTRPRSTSTSARVDRAITRLGTWRPMPGCSNARVATAPASSSSPAKNSARA